MFRYFYDARFRESGNRTNPSEFPNVSTIDVSLLYRSILEHNPDIAHLITDHPTGILWSYNRKIFGEEEWQSRYGFPVWGFSAAYQDMKTYELGEAYSAYAHYNFHFFKRHLQWRKGQGPAYLTKPFDAIENSRNNAYRTRITSTTYLNAVYRKENIMAGLGFHAGVTIIHYSNANVRAPNNSTNTWFFQAGLNYTLNPDAIPEFKTRNKRSYSEPISYNFVGRMGLNESDYRGSGQFPFYNFSLRNGGMAYGCKTTHHRNHFWLR